MNQTTFKCRSCGSEHVEPILSFGRTPLADALLTGDQLTKDEISAPLDVVFCTACSLVQITATVPPEILFCRDYPYFSSVSKALLRHFAASAAEIMESRKLSSDSLVVEAASNDGYMLQNFADHGIPVLGIDPAEGPVQSARKKGVNSVCDFFSRDLAEKLRQEGKQADVFLANNVLAHVADLNGFVDGIHAVLKPTGVAVIEVPYLVDLIDKCEFDTIYHQHLCYFSGTALEKLFRAHDLYLNDVRRTAIHGGSLRLFVEKSPHPSAALQALLAEEKSAGVDSVEYYRPFAERVEAVRRDLTALLQDLKSRGKSIAGYAAAAKATTLLSFCDIDKRLLDYVVDLNEFKQGRYMPGNHLPIYSPQKLIEEKPDYVLISGLELRRRNHEAAASVQQFRGAIYRAHSPPLHCERRFHIADTQQLINSRRFHMNTIYTDSRFDDERRRQLLYQGQLFSYSSRRSIRDLCDFAGQMIREAFGSLDPLTAQFDMSVEEFVSIFGPLKPKFIHHPHTKEVIRAVLSDFGCDLENTYQDVPRLRAVTSDGYLTSGVGYAHHPHRDTWYSAPFQQINWWLPIFEMASESSMAFHPHYWSAPVKNGSDSFNYYEWNSTGRATAAQHIKTDTRKQPKPEQPMELDPQVRIVPEPGGVILFSAAQMHSTVPNTSGKTRFSIDFRTVHLADVKSQTGAHNIDSACTGTSLRDFLRASDLSVMPDSVVSLYEPEPVDEGVLVFKP